MYTAAVVLWLDKHVSDFLRRFTNVTNQLACIVRSFENLEYLRVLAAVIVLVGVHLVEPFLSLTTSASTTWEKLREAFPQLHSDLTSTDPVSMLGLTEPAFSFVSKERYVSTLYHPDLLQPVKEIIEEFQPEVISMLKLLLPKLADGWCTQRGEIFDFGEGKDKENSLKLKDFDAEKLKDAPIHNLSSETAVGSVNYGLKVYGNKQLNVVSSSLVKASASQLLEGKTPTPEMKKLAGKDGEIPQILQKWKEKQDELRKQVVTDFSFAYLLILCPIICQMNNSPQPTSIIKMYLSNSFDVTVQNLVELRLVYQSFKSEMLSFLDKLT